MCIFSVFLFIFSKKKIVQEFPCTCINLASINIALMSYSAAQQLLLWPNTISALTACQPWSGVTVRRERMQSGSSCDIHSALNGTAIKAHISFSFFFPFNPPSPPSSLPPCYHLPPQGTKARGFTWRPALCSLTPNPALRRAPPAPPSFFTPPHSNIRGPLSSCAGPTIPSPSPEPHMRQPQHADPN